MPAGSYRADIDGLRAVAIVPVLFFHARFATFGGGFVGVDVFFVISGYLITSLIVRELDAGTFSFIDFWARRARRILPAAFVAIMATLAAGWFILLPSDYENLAQSALAQTLFASNLFFWKHTGYFGAETMPLLHYWSLAVEEQYYMVFPLVLFVLTRYGKMRMFWLIATVGLVSFGVNVWAVTNTVSAAFFFLPTRAWELLTGSLLAFLAGRGPGRTSTTLVDELLALGGMAAILFAVVQYDQNTPFPGTAALSPSLGTAAIIWANRNHRTIVGRLLSTRPFVLIGLISYSLYLWHWPLFVYARYLSFEELAPTVTVSLLIASTLIAYCSYRFVETPIRRRAFIDRPQMLLGFAFCSLVLIGICSLWLDMSGGAPDRFPRAVVAYANGVRDVYPHRSLCHDIESQKIENDELCSFGEGEGRLFVWGDSHGVPLTTLIESLAVKHGTRVWTFTRGGCPPILGTYRPLYQYDECEESKTQVMSFLKRHDVRNVLLIARWSIIIFGSEDGQFDFGLLSDEQTTSKTPDDAKVVFRRNFANMIGRFRELGIRVWIMKQVPLHKRSVPFQLARTQLYGGDTQSVGRLLSEHRERQFFANSVIDELVQDGVVAIDPAEILCSDGYICRGEMNGRSLYVDKSHLSSFGAIRLRPLIESMFTDIRAEVGQVGVAAPLR